MVRSQVFRGFALLSLAATVACSQGAQTPVSPSAAAGSSAANPDGSTLKVSAPVLLSPVGGERVGNRRPTFAFNNSTGKFASVNLTYRLELLDGSGNFVIARSVQQGGGPTTYDLDTELVYNVDVQWRVRAEIDGQIGPWSSIETFKSPVQPTAGGPATGNVGPQRSIPFGEAVGIIINIHNTLRVNLGSSSTRDYRIAFLNAAVAAIHYGHPRFNAAGPDPNWCVKDAGGGRPQSDDVLVVCSTRDAWDLIGGAGANGYSFHEDYLGRLPSIQNVYPPPRSALSFLGQ
jgi:hypothetical protein